MESPNAEPDATGFHRSLPGYGPTPLVALPALAATLGVRAVWVKDESDRLGLAAFKILGASWAVNRALSERAGVRPATSLAALTEQVSGSPATLVAATDGNHGRAVARMARLLGMTARIYVPAVISAAAVAAISAEGAEVIQTGEVYDQAVRRAAASCTDRADQVLVQDTSWPGYEQIPQWIVDGYDTLFAEIDDQLGGDAVDLVTVPTGVGSLLQAALEHYRGTPRPAVLSVEPVAADCVARSLAAGRPITVDTSAPTIMAGLNCGNVSMIAWPTIRDELDGAVAVTDAEAQRGVRQLAEHGVASGPCGAAALAGLIAALENEAQRSALRLGADTSVVLISTEGPISRA